MSRSFSMYHVDSRIARLVSMAAQAMGELPAEFVEYALLMRVLEIANRPEVEDVHGNTAEDLYGEIHQRWEDWWRESVRAQLPF